MNTKMNFALFVLTGSAWCIAAVGVATLLAWWFLSDFYMMKYGSWWSEWLDRYAFVFASAGIVLILDLVGCTYLRVLAKRRSTRLGLCLNGSSLSAQAWCEMLEEVARGENSSVSRRYLLWESTRLAHLEPAAIFEARNIVGAWWFNPRAIVPVLITLSWLPMLWVALAMVPMHTRVMEFVSSALGGHANRLFDFRNAVEISTNGGAEIVEEELQRDPRDGSLFRASTALLGRGTLTVRGTDFPRIYRRIIAECSGMPPACAFSRTPGTSKIVVRLRAGASRLDFIQPPSEIHLNMGLSFQSEQGDGFDYVIVEPK